MRPALPISGHTVAAILAVQAMGEEVTVTEATPRPQTFTTSEALPPGAGGSPERGAADMSHRAGSWSAHRPALLEDGHLHSGLGPPGCGRPQLPVYRISSRRALRFTSSAGTGDQRHDF